MTNLVGRAKKFEAKLNEKKGQDNKKSL